MAVDVRIDSSDFRHLAAAIAGLPQDIKVKAISRALRRVGEMTRTRVVKRTAERIDIAQKHVRERILLFNAGGDTVELIARSGWIPLYKLGARQGKSGASVANRGTYPGSFIATMKSGHAGVFKRVGDERLPIRELFGPNPASDIFNHEDVYAEVLHDVAEQYLVPRVLHEVERLWGALG